MENNSGFKNVKHPAKISSYLALEKKDLIIVSISGVLYNVGMILGPYFEGQMAQCLFDIYKEKSTFRDMAFLALIYVISIAFVQAMRAVKRFFVRHFSNNTSLNMRHVIYRSMLHADSNQSSDSGRNSQKEVEFVADTDGSKGEKDSVEKSDKGEAESSGVDVGTLMTKAIEDVDACAEGLRKFITEIFDTGVVMIAYLAMLIYYDWRLTIISVLFSPIAYFIADRLKKPVTSASAEQKESAGKLNTSTLDRISNALTYRIYGVEKVHEEKYEERLSDYEKKSVRANIFQSSLQPIYLVISMLGVIPILIFGGKNVLGTGWTAWDIAAFTAFFSCFSKLAKKSSHAANLFNAVQKAEVSWKRIEPIMKEAESDKDGNSDNIGTTEKLTGAGAQLNAQKDSAFVNDFTLSFDNVTILKEKDEPLLFLLTRFFQKRSLSAQMENRRAVGKVNSTLPETIENGRMIRNLHAENFMERRYDRFIRDSFEATDRINIYDSLYSPIIKTMAAVAIGIMMASAASGTALATLFGIGVGTAVTFMAYVNNIFEPLSDIGMEIQTIQAAGAGVRRIGEFLNYDANENVSDDIKSELDENGAKKVKSEAGGNGTVIVSSQADEFTSEMKKTKLAVTFSHVTFGYDPSKIILHDFSLDVKPGEHVTLVGRTGAGKSTIFNLMNGLYSPQSGSVKIFGADAADIKANARRKLITTVTQDFTEVEGTLRDQISLGDKNISDEDIENALAIAGLSNTISELPYGLDTPFKDVTFSMGERSLLGIARAVASNPKILLLDEITANLDTNTESMIMAAIEKAAKNRTVISISHRLSAALDFDRIVEI